MCSKTRARRFNRQRSPLHAAPRSGSVAPKLRKFFSCRYKGIDFIGAGG